MPEDTQKESAAPVRLSVDAVLEEQGRAPAFLATLEALEDRPDKVKVTPWMPGDGCQCHLARAVPRAAIEAERTPHSHLCCGKTLPVWALHFREGATIPATELFAAPLGGHEHHEHGYTS